MPDARANPTHRVSLGFAGIENGAAERTRTSDPIITNDVLYQLSYSGLVGFGVPSLRMEAFA